MDPLVSPMRRRSIAILATVAISLGSGIAASAAANMEQPSSTSGLPATTPAWPFFVPDATAPALDRPAEYGLPGSSKRYTQTQIDDLKAPPDWYPAAHSVPPRAVIKGGQGPAFACGSCHLMSGMGHAESASLAGLPVDYFTRQVADFRSGGRAHRFIAAGKPVLDNVGGMIAVAKAWPASDIAEAARYFATLPRLPWIKVIETTTVPSSYVNAQFSRLPVPGNGRERLGSRIIELPQDLERQLRRDPTSGAVAYVPVGSVGRGRSLATERAQPCSSCHGIGLRGAGDIPAIAGRSPVYIYRQLLLFKDGSRHGDLAPLMRDRVATMSSADMIAVSAYVASLKP